MREYHFSAELARQYGLDEAVMLHHLAYWVQKNTLDGRNIHDGRAWTYNSQESFQEWFPFWSRRQIQRVLKSLEEQQAIIKGNYNVKPMDRTLWYTLSDGVLAHYAIRPPAEPQTGQSTDRNGAMDGTEPCDGTHETVPAIPKSKHKEKTKETHSDGAGERPARRAGQNESGGNGPHHPCPGIPGDGSADEPADRQQQGYLSGTGRSNPCICQDGGRVSPGQG